MEKAAAEAVEEREKALEDARRVREWDDKIRRSPIKICWEREVIQQTFRALVLKVRTCARHKNLP